MSKNNDNIPSSLRKIEVRIFKLIKKLKAGRLDYTVQVSIHSLRPTHVSWAAQITEPADGLAPISFIRDSADELVEAIKDFEKHNDLNSVEIAYHEAQAENARKAIAAHEDAIEKIKNGELDYNAHPNDQGVSDVEE